MPRLDSPKWMVQSHVKFWDETHSLVGSLNNSSDVQPDGEDCIVEFPLTEQFAIDVLRQYQPCAFMTIDGSAGRWYGVLAHFTVQQNDAGDATLIARFREQQP